MRYSHLLFLLDAEAIAVQPLVVLFLVSLSRRGSIKQVLKKNLEKLHLLGWIFSHWQDNLLSQRTWNKYSDIHLSNPKVLDWKAKQGKYTTGKYRLQSVFALPLGDLFQLAPGEPTKIFRKSQNLINLHLKKKNQTEILLEFSCTR